MLSHTLVEGLGMTAGVLGIFAWIPQIYKVWVEKQHKGISLTTMYIVGVCICLWIVYGVFKNAFAVIVCNVFVLILLVILIAGVHKWRWHENRKTL